VPLTDSEGQLTNLEVQIARIRGYRHFRFPFCVDTGMDDRDRLVAADAVAARLKEILLQKGLGVGVTRWVCNPARAIYSVCGAGCPEGKGEKCRDT
jgi:hypothetical protein